jgi:septal ring factor EnvC (AmiA/AmiB activator)
MTKVKLFLRKALLVIGTLALIASVCVSGLFYVNNRAMERQIHEQSDQVSTLSTQVGKLTATNGLDESQLATLREQVNSLAPDNEKLKASVGAFATQAAACDTLKKTLNVKG